MAETSTNCGRRLCWRRWVRCPTLAVCMAGGILWEPSWGWRYAPCCAVPAVSTPSVSGAGTKAWRVSQALGFTRERTPCVSTLHQVSSRLDRDAFELALGQWLQGRGLRQGERWPQTASGCGESTGTTARSSPGGGLRPSVRYRGGTAGVGDKRNGLDAVPGLLEQLDLAGRVVTGDAQFTQRRVCQRIVPRGHYFLGIISLCPLRHREPAQQTQVA